MLIAEMSATARTLEKGRSTGIGTGPFAKKAQKWP
jgi:hypothetical protein